jgi:hypothetical protein
MRRICSLIISRQTLQTLHPKKERNRTNWTPKRIHIYQHQKKAFIALMALYKKGAELEKLDTLKKGIYSRLFTPS